MAHRKRSYTAKRNRGKAAEVFIHNQLKAGKQKKDASLEQQRERTAKELEDVLNGTNGIATKTMSFIDNFDICSGLDEMSTLAVSIRDMRHYPSAITVERVKTSCGAASSRMKASRQDVGSSKARKELAKLETEIADGIVLIAKTECPAFLEQPVMNQLMYESYPAFDSLYAYLKKKKIKKRFVALGLPNNGHIGMVLSLYKIFQAPALEAIEAAKTEAKVLEKQLAAKAVVEALPPEVDLEDLQHKPMRFEQRGYQSANIKIPSIIDCGFQFNPQGTNVNHSFEEAQNKGALPGILLQETLPPMASEISVLLSECYLQAIWVAQEDYTKRYESLLIKLDFLLSTDVTDPRAYEQIANSLSALHSDLSKAPAGQKLKKGSLGAMSTIPMVFLLVILFVDAAFGYILPAEWSGGTPSLAADDLGWWLFWLSLPVLTLFVYPSLPKKRQPAGASYTDEASLKNCEHTVATSNRNTGSDSAGSIQKSSQVSSDPLDTSQSSGWRKLHWVSLTLMGSSTLIYALTEAGGDPDYAINVTVGASIVLANVYYLFVKRK
jgi:hypothetical protein